MSIIKTLSNLLFTSFVLLYAYDVAAQDQPEEWTKKIDSIQKVLDENPHLSVQQLLSRQAMGEEYPIYRISYWDSLANDCRTLIKPNSKEKNTISKILSSSENNLGFLINNSGNFEEALKHFEACIQIQKEINDKTGLARSYNNLAYSYDNQGLFNKSVEYYLKTIDTWKEDDNQYEIAESNSELGVLYYEHGKSDSALLYYNKCLEIHEKLGNKVEVAAVLNNIAVLHMMLGDVKLGIDYFTKILKIQESEKDFDGMATSYNNIGYIYANQKDVKLAVKYFNNSLELYTKLKSKKGMASCYSNLANMSSVEGDFDKALDYYLKAYDIHNELYQRKFIAEILTNIGAIYVEKAGYFETQGIHADSIKFYREKALSTFEESLEISLNVDSKSGPANTYKLLGDYYFKEYVQTEKQADLNKSLKYAKESFRISNEINFPEEIKKSANLLSRIYVKMGKGMDAYNMFKLYVEMRDSLTNEETYKAAIQQNAKYEYEKQATADSIVNAEAEKVHLANLEAEKAIGDKQKTEIAAQKKQNIYLFIGLGLVALFGFFMFNRFKVTQKQKGIIEDQKLEVETQKVTVEKTLQKLEFTHEQLEESHREITDSINYAERIQRSFLATKETLDENLKDYFVFFKPKEAVSGDFYWAAQLNNNNFAFTVADSTGHGVPGAIMSLLNITSLEKSIETEIEPHNILNKTREIIISRLKKDGSEHGGKDGMDCNLMVLNQDKSVLSFASANNTIVIIRNGEILEYKGDKMPVGKHDRDTESFTLHSVQLQKGDVIYALTDGFPDQFGGPKGKKYMIKSLKNKFLQIADKPMEAQEEILSEEFSNWMQDNEQIDDVCIIGVRV